MRSIGGICSHRKIDQSADRQMERYSAESSRSRIRHHRVATLLIFGVASALFGCRTVSPQKTIKLPVSHSIESDQLLIMSDMRLGRDHPLVTDLISLRKQVADTLNLPLNGRQVVVYLFGNETQYRQYISAAYPELPHRRAYFVGTPERLAVYTFWGERIQEDLRHEFTHGLLHASLKSVPLWLDEGIAEYFEVIGPVAGGVNSGYASDLTQAVSNGWRPDMQRLEQLVEVAHMQRTDYQESWGWVHFMLNSSPDSRQLLLDYVQDLRADPDPGPLSVRLAGELPLYDERFLGYLTALDIMPAVATASDDFASQ